MNKLILFLLACVQLSLSQKCLKTNSKPPQSNTACIFPFTHKGETHQECAVDPKNPDGQKWCSTKVDQYGIHQNGQYGYCDPSKLLYLP